MRLSRERKIKLTTPKPFLTNFFSDLYDKRRKRTTRIECGGCRAY